MTDYLNLSGNSGVAGFEIYEGSIVVEFKDGSQYLYDYATTGAENVEQMKNLAVTGSGLNSFINRYVRKRYARKLR